MVFDFTSLEPLIHEILEAPGVDLATISAKRVRKQLSEKDPSLTAEFLREQKNEIGEVITVVFARVSAKQGLQGADSDDDGGSESALDASSDDVQEEVEERAPTKKKKAALPPIPRKKSIVQSDAELARQLSEQINGRSTRRGTTKSRGSGNNKKSNRAKKSAATIDSGDESDSADGGVRRTKKSGKTGNAKGGFAKEYLLSPALASLLHTEKLSRPQVVKQLWQHIKGNELQNPKNRKEIICDDGFKAVFHVDKIDMFQMNKVLTQHLSEQD